MISWIKKIYLHLSPIILRKLSNNESQLLQYYECHYLPKHILESRAAISWVVALIPIKLLTFPRVIISLLYSKVGYEATVVPSLWTTSPASIEKGSEEYTENIVTKVSRTTLVLVKSVPVHSMKTFFVNIRLIFDIEKWLWKSEFCYIWPSIPNQAKYLESFYGRFHRPLALFTHH